MANGDKITGTVEALEVKHTNRGIDINIIKVNGVGYEYGKATPPCNVGDQVEFIEEYKWNTSRVAFKTLQVQGVAYTGGGRKVNNAGQPVYGFPIPLRDKQRSIIRQNSLAHATQVYVAGTFAIPTGQEVAASIIKMARSFEEYSAGDIERKEAEARKANAKVVPEHVPEKMDVEQDLPIDVFGDTDVA